MCDMPIPFGAEFDASAPGSFEMQPSSSSRDNAVPQSPLVDPIRSAYVPRYTQTNIPGPLYYPPRKSPQASESLQTFSYYPSNSYATSSSSFPQQEYYFTGPSTNSQSMHQFYGREASTNYHPSYQYQPIQLKPTTTVEQFPMLHQSSGIVDPRVSNGGPYAMRRRSHGTCEKCGSFNSSNEGYYHNFMAMSNSEPLQRFAEVGSNGEMAAAPNRRPYRFYYQPSPSNLKHREHILF